MQKKYSIHIKKGDYVQVISGKHKGLKGEVSQVMHKKNQVIVDGVNMIKKHIKPKNENSSGEIISIEAPIHCSNVKLSTTNK